jgi:hypothetical protein
MWARNPYVAPAESLRTRISVPCRWTSGICCSARSSTVMWSAVVFDPARPSRSSPDKASRVLSRKQNSGWNPNVFFQVRVAFSLSEWQITIEASRSNTRPGTGRPAAIEVGSPPRVSAACAHATSRAAARAVRSAANPAPSTSDSSRQAVGSDATDPNNSHWSRSTARSAIASPPSATITAKSTATRPGSWPPRRCRNPASARLNCSVRPVASATSAKRRAPAWPTTPRPSALTVILGRPRLAFTYRVPSVRERYDLQQALSSQLRRHPFFLDPQYGRPLNEGPRLGIRTPSIRSDASPKPDQSDGLSATRVTRDCR